VTAAVDVINFFLTSEGDRAWEKSSIDNPTLFASKDEFEKEEEFDLRFRQASKIFMTQIALENKDRQTQIEKRIANSIVTVDLTIDQVGSYDADKELLPVTVKGSTENILMNRDEARSFKENISTVKVTGIKKLKDDLNGDEIVNIKITHPTTGKEYKFGNQVFLNYNLKEDALLNLVGEWEGNFGENQILLVIDEIKGNQVNGYNVIQGKKRILSGTIDENKYFVLTEPGDDEWDGVFRFKIVNQQAKGKWNANNGKLSIDFVLDKR